MISNVTAANSAYRFQIRDYGISRSDLAARKEIKYTLSHADLGKLRTLLSANCRRLIHNEPVSTVRSIYFDDPRLSACRANLHGLGRRRKLRLRWYDTLLPDRDFFFEIKWRENRVTGKHRLQLASADPLHRWSYEQILHALEQTLPHRFLNDLWRYTEPVVLIEYKREHFASRDGSLRVTLDYDITYYDQLGRRHISTAFGRRLEGLTVLEGKTPIGRESELRALLHPFPGRVGRCSKYVHGCQLLGHVSPRA